MRRVLELLAASVLIVASGQASIIVTLDNPTQSGLPGDTLSFAGSIENDGDSEIFLNANALNFSGDGTNFATTDNFFANVPISIQAGETVTGISFFDIFISPSFATTFGAYPGSYGLIGGLTADDQEVLGSIDFTVNVNEPQVQTGDAPEPATLGLAAIALALVFARKRLRAN